MAQYGSMRLSLGAGASYGQTSLPVKQTASRRKAGDMRLLVASWQDLVPGKFLASSWQVPGKFLTYVADDDIRIYTYILITLSHMPLRAGCGVLGSHDVFHYGMSLLNIHLSAVCHLRRLAWT